MITIGDKKYSVSKPKDLDEVLTAATGINAEETARGLQAGYASHLARALHPFLSGDDVPGVNDLAMQIDTAGVEDVRPQVRALYAKPEAKAAPAKGGA